MALQLNAQSTFEKIPQENCKSSHQSEEMAVLSETEMWRIVDVLLTVSVCIKKLADCV